MGRIYLSALVLLLVTACGAPPAPQIVSQPATVVASPTREPAPSPTPSPVEERTSPARARPQGAPVFTYQVVATYPHDPDAFTQGLVYTPDDVLYEGTGLYGESTLRRVELTTGKVRQQHDLADDYFGEGITVFQDRIVQLTWKSNVGFVYDRTSFEQLDTFTYPTEGWGLTTDGSRLIMSDGSASLFFLDPETYERIGQIEVRDHAGPVTRLNELEYIDGRIYANVWQTDRIAIIAPETGQVEAWIDLTGLLPAEDRRQRVDVLNGIAYDAARDRLFVTGKWWPRLFEIELLPVEDGP